MQTLNNVVLFFHEGQIWVQIPDWGLPLPGVYRFYPFISSIFNTTAYFPPVFIEFKMSFCCFYSLAFKGLMTES